jgi:clan AA aspartic protease (TIGR02281 family)
MNVIDTSKADIVDTTHVDDALASARRNEENARKRATLLTWGKVALLGGVGVAAILFAASFLLQPRVIETTKVVEKPVIIEKQVVVERDAKPKPPEAPPTPPAKIEPTPPAKVAPPLPPPAPASNTETHPWDKLTDKEYRGTITDANVDHVCYAKSNETPSCVEPVLVDATGHAVLDPEGNDVADRTRDTSPMGKWIGYSVYSAKNPNDPEHLAHYWVADNGTLIHFESVPRGNANVIMLRSDGQSLVLDVGLGEMVREFILDTGASSMTVTADVAAQLVAAGHATPHGAETVTYADGKPHVVQTITIDKVRVGTHFVHDVHATVTPSGAPMLLGLDVLNAIGRFEIDAPHRTLTFNGGV